MKVTVSHHAVDEAVKDFRVDRRVAEEWIRNNFRKATFVSDIVSEDGKPCRLFGYQRIAFIMAQDADHIVTVYPRNTSTVHAKVKALIDRELKRAQKKESQELRKIRIEKAQLNVERANCSLRMELTPSAAVVRNNTKRIADIDAELARLDSEILRIKKEKSSVAKSVVMYI